MSEATDVLHSIDQLRRDLSGYHGQLKAHNDLQIHCDRQRERIAELEGLYVKSKAESAKLREQMERLVTLLRNDCDIEASWDGLRRFWSIELTEDGCLMRDRACKAEAENAKLRELVNGLDHCTTWANEDGKDCWSCPLWHEKDCTAEDIERELGIEVK